MARLLGSGSCLKCQVPLAGSIADDVSSEHCGRFPESVAGEVGFALGSCSETQSHKVAAKLEGQVTVYEPEAKAKAAQRMVELDKPDVNALRLRNKCK